MKTKLFASLTLFCVSNYTYASSVQNDSNLRFERIILSKNIIAECDARKGDERGPFGITYKDGQITHTFLIMTGVYYDTCKKLEKEINRLKRKESKILLTGTVAHSQAEKNEVIWRWESIKSLSGKICISYFTNDCEK